MDDPTDWQIIAVNSKTAQIRHDGKHVGYITHESTNERQNSNGSTYERRVYLLQAREVRVRIDGEHRILCPTALSVSFMGTTPSQEEEG